VEAATHWLNPSFYDLNTAPASIFKKVVLVAGLEASHDDFVGDNLIPEVMAKLRLL